jgi:phosphate transport system substrate-binding protein
MKRSGMLMPVTLVLLVFFLIQGGLGTSKSTPRLEGAGSTFVDPMMQEWADVYRKLYNVEVNYQAKGSGAGIRMPIDREVDFGCSDAPLSEEQLATAASAGGEVLHIPVCMGAIVMAYNLPGISDLTLSGQVLMEIYLGKIKCWDHQAIAKLNPNVKLPHTGISAACRSDSSGSTYILTDYFTKIDKKAWWPGKGTTIQLPGMIASQGTSAVAAYVKQTSGAIGYIELIYALKSKINFAKMINAKGNPIKADIKSVMAAAVGASIPDDLRFSITNASGPDSYPISGTVWALVYVNQPGDKVKHLTDFLTWVTHDGQKECEKLEYAPLLPALVKKIEAKLATIQRGK